MNLFQLLFGGRPQPAENGQRKAVDREDSQSARSRSVQFVQGDLIKDRWKVHKVLGGGMGTIYVVYDHKWKEVLAAKTFHSHLFESNPVIREIFEKEALVWINLDLHDNIAEARFLENIEGQPFLFLEYVPGGDLSNWILNNELVGNTEVILELGLQFCDGMIHVGKKGVKVHRDIKPQNCLISKDGSLKITDFGMAKAWASSDLLITNHSESRSKDLHHSKTGTAAGTCTHMAPEQFLDAKRVDTRADIYSFGVMLYQMISGRLPFEATSFEEFAAFHLRTMPKLNVIENLQLRQVVEQCLQKHPSDRFPDFLSLRHALEKIYKSETGRLPHQPKEGDALTAYHLVNKGKSLGDLGYLPESIDCFDRALEMFPTMPEAWFNKGASLREAEQCLDALACYRRALEENPKMALAWSHMGEVLVSLNRCSDAIDAFDRAIAISSNDASCWYWKGCALTRLNRPKDSIIAYQNALRIRPNDYATLFNMAHSFGMIGSHDDVIRCCDVAIKIDPNNAKGYTLRGAAYLSLGEKRVALESLNAGYRLGDLEAKQLMVHCQ